MTKEEAISTLKLINTEENGIIRKPLNMAIKSLEAWKKVLIEIDIVKCGDWIATETVRDIINNFLGVVEE